MTDMTLADFDYHLPPRLIAQVPVRPRDSSRLLLLDRERETIEHRHFFNLPDYLRPGDLLILNNSRVFPARLIGHKKNSGGQVEIFLHRQLQADIWECLLGDRVQPGLELVLSDAMFAQPLVQLSHGLWQVKFSQTGDHFWQIVNTIGQIPLPPYIKRPEIRPSDSEDYQTVFADQNQSGSVAAPTAGLHFTQDLLQEIARRGVEIAYITLHVGLGTFAPVKVDRITDHRLHAEFVSIDASAVSAISQAKRAKRRIIAVGTTSVRALESMALDNKQTQSFWTDKFIYPGYQFTVVDALISNFHLPRSSLLMLVSALAGRDRILQVYQEAVRLNYRFFSYGDAMFIY